MACKLRWMSATLWFAADRGVSDFLARLPVRLWILRIEKSMEGDQFRRFHELKVERGEHPIFMLSWTIFHTIDPESPLYGMTAEKMAKTDSSLVLNVSGGPGDNQVWPYGFISCQTCTRREKVILAETALFVSVRFRRRCKITTNKIVTV